ncbi:MAG: NADP-dependent malic enzyme [Ferrovibrio sp.]|uniref:NADP-dependent malic enzyme n=1 Tax=Ferrovibrio sp. TaxID=1917215 RepID=UPI002612FD78|nr:NADP-dependent malic enzyme [Ferrovibrio sp.]MCW0235563.1 NADP-dependent malic enzyme [Ferrovibrio sp.]
MSDSKSQSLYDDALEFHKMGQPGKLEVVPTKPMATTRDLSLAYSPGVAAPCLEIQKNPDTAYDYTSRGNMVAVISNGTAVLGLGNLGALAGKPVMEGKAVLFKRFADVDCIDLEVDTENVDEFVNAVRYLGPSFGGINLEDIKAPECFVIEQRLRELMDIPIFHDDQHGTAIIAAAGMINALHLTGRDIKDAKMVVNGAGAAGIACTELMKAMGMRHENVILCDTKGVVYQGRTDGMNQWKSAHAVKTAARSLEDAMKGADVFFGLSAKGAVTSDMLRSMAAHPIVFAMANPDPEITPEDALATRGDVIMATGRSDYPNQVNNVLGFPYIFRGALDVRARTINDEMKIAAAEAIAKLARQDVPDEVAAAYKGDRPKYGPGYIIPSPFDPRLIVDVPLAVAKAAVKSGVARKPITDWAAYAAKLRARLNPTVGSLQIFFDQVVQNPKRVVFAEGEEETVIRAALEFRAAGYGTPVLIGRSERIEATMKAIGLANLDGCEIHNARISEHNAEYADFLYRRHQRRGLLHRDVQRFVNLDRNVFGACMVANGHADAMITGVTRTYSVSYDGIRMAIDAQRGQRVMGLSIIVAKGRTVFVADTTVTETPSASDLCQIAIQAARAARQMGQEPRVALLSHSNFGNAPGGVVEVVRHAVMELDSLDAGGHKVDFEYDGELNARVALNPDLMKLYPFCRLSGPANVLIMPGLHSALLSTQLMQDLGGGTVIGPLLIGLEKPVQIAQMGASVSDIVNLAALAAYNAR